MKAKEEAQKRSRHLANVLRAHLADASEAVQVLGPVACPLSRLRGRYRWHLAVRAPSGSALLGLLRAALTELTAGERAGMTLDIDPLTML